MRWWLVRPRKAFSRDLLISSLGCRRQQQRLGRQVAYCRCQGHRRYCRKCLPIAICCVTQMAITTADLRYAVTGGRYDTHCAVLVTAGADESVDLLRLMTCYSCLQLICLLPKQSKYRLCSALGVYLHCNLDQRECPDTFTTVNCILNQLSDSGVKALARLQEQFEVFPSERHAVMQQVSHKIRNRRTLSKPAMFLFSAKNSAGLFCCSLSAPLLEPAFDMMPLSTLLQHFHQSFGCEARRVSGPGACLSVQLGSLHS